MFNTENVGNRIAELRKKSNMTQFELADKLGISFQAVSNWERGNSMPDISKLPQIAELFNTSIDDIITKPNKVLTEMVKDKEINIGTHTSEDVCDAAALIQPQKIKEIIEHSDFTFKISALLPFLDNDYVEELADRYYQAAHDVSIFLPFLSSFKIKELMKQHLEKKESINKFLPFISKEDIESLGEKYIMMD